MSPPHKTIHSLILRAGKAIVVSCAVACAVLLALIWARFYLIVSALTVAFAAPTIGTKERAQVLTSGTTAFVLALAYESLVYLTLRAFVLSKRQGGRRPFVAWVVMIAMGLSMILLLTDTLRFVVLLNGGAFGWLHELPRGLSLTACLLGGWAIRTIPPHARYVVLLSCGALAAASLAVWCLEPSYRSDKLLFFGWSSIAGTVWSLLFVFAAQSRSLRDYLDARNRVPAPLVDAR